MSFFEERRRPKEDRDAAALDALRRIHARARAVEQSPLPATPAPISPDGTVGPAVTPDDGSRSRVPA